MDPLLGRARQVALTTAITIDVAVLGVFKYADFTALTLAKATQPLGLKLLAPALPLPLGISFFTFHCLSYLIDLYRRRFPVNRRLWELGLEIQPDPRLRREHGRSKAGHAGREAGRLNLLSL